MLRTPFRLAASAIFVLAGIHAAAHPATAQNPGVAKALTAAVAVELRDASDRPLRQVNGTLVPEGVVVQTSSLLGATKAIVKSHSGGSWTATEILAANGAIGLALLRLPSAPEGALTFPPSGAYMAKSRVFLLNGPGVGPDSVSATIYEHFSLRGTPDLSPVTPGAPGAAPVVDPSGRLLGVACDLSEGPSRFGFIVPMASVRVLSSQGTAAAPITSYNATGGPVYEDRTATTGLVFRGAVLARAERYDDARIFLAEALKKDPASAEAYFWNGQAFFGLEQFQRAAEEFQLAGSKDPSYHLAWHMAGAALNQAADYAGAERLYRKALEIKPGAADTYCNLGGAYFNMQRMDDAIAAFRKSIEIDPRYARGLAFMNLALVYNGMGRRDDAEQVYEDLRRVNPQWAERLRAALDGQPR